MKTRNGADPFEAGVACTDCRMAMAFSFFVLAVEFLRALS